MSNLAGVTFSGLSSGIDSESIIRRLMQIESLPIQRMQAQQAQLTAKQGIYDQLKSRISSVAGAAVAINNANAFNPIKAISSVPENATITATAGANAGVYNLNVTQLAQAHKISTSAQASATSALNYSGQLVVNGRGISVDVSDSLTSIAAKIDGLSSGVVASVIDGGTNNAYLTLTSSTSGAASKLQVASVGTDTLADQLGLLSGGATIREPITGGAASYKFASNSQKVGDMLGLTGLGTTTVTVGTGSVSIDLQNDTLQTIADKINDPLNGTGAVALVKSVVENGVTKYRLEVTGTTTFGSEGNVMQTLGILQRGYGTQVVAAQDANFTLDGIAITSASNTVTTAIPNATITLLKSGVSTTLTLSRDTDAIKGNIKTFVDAYNSLVDFIQQNSEFNKDTFESGPLLGDSVASQVESTFSSMLFNSVSGTGGQYTNLAQLGFSFDDKGKLTVDDAKLSSALTNDPEAVGRLFRAIGSTSTGTLVYVTASNKTRSSTGDGYDVVISQLASKGNTLASMAQTLANAAPEELTFSGSIFGGTNYVFSIASGQTQAQTVTAINNDAKLKDLVVATVSGGKLLITSKTFGKNGDFSVVSNLAAGNDNSGIGTDTSGHSDGLDVAGTINGEDATGNGQFLIGNAGNANTDGLQVQYTGATTGAVGKVKYSKGVAAQINDQVALFTDSVNGVFTSTNKSLQSLIDDLASSITSLQERLATKEQDLRRKFAAMEEAISQLQNQNLKLNSITNR